VVFESAMLAEDRGFKLKEAHRGTALGEDYARHFDTYTAAALILRTEEERRSRTVWQRFANWLGGGA
jgi:hypothetical protein